MTAGTARRDITPEPGCALSGYAGRGAAEAVLDPLELTALVWSDQGPPIALVTFDLLGVDDAFDQELSAALAAVLGSTPEAVLLACSHTHGGPVFCENLPDEAPRLDRVYRRRVFEAACEAVREAAEAPAEVVATFGTGTAALGLNRRAPGPPYAMVPNPAGYDDRTVNALTFRRPGDAKPLAILFSAACHPTTLGARRLLSADWPGAARRAIEAAVPGCTSLFVQGCAGNIRPRTVDFAAPDRFRPGTPDDVARIGAVCAHEVLRLALDADLELSGPLRARRIDCPLPLTGGGTMPYRVQAISAGRGWSLVALPGEPVNEYAALLAGMAPDRAMLVAGYCNGLPGYVPTQAILDEGGYESGDGSNRYFGLPSRLADGPEALLAAAVAEAAGLGPSGVEEIGRGRGA